MSNRSALARLRKELKIFDPPPYIRAAPLENNMQEWRFVIQGPHDSPYEGGMYQGKVKFPDDYPFKPPSIYMLTPNGRFETDRRLCLSISDFHPESWIPTWSVASIINGVLSFMLEDTPTTGAIVTTLAEKHRLRGASVAFNRGDPIFRALFPELVEGQPFTPKPTPPPEAPVQGSTAAPEAPDADVEPTPHTVDGHAEASVSTAAASDDSEPAPGSGKNAAKNKKKREAAKAKKRQGASGSEDMGGDASESGEPDRSSLDIS